MPCLYDMSELSLHQTNKMSDSSLSISLSWKKVIYWYVLSTSFFISLFKKSSVSYIYHRSYHFFLLGFAHHLHQRVLRHVDWFFAGRWLDDTSSCFLFGFDPFLPTGLKGLLLEVPVAFDWHDLKQHPPHIEPRQSMCFALLDIIIQLSGMRGREKHELFKMLEVDLPRHITQNFLESVWHFTLLLTTK